jgi:hypothetical protein
MSELVRPEHAERVRDFYRNQGAAKEREAILEIIQRVKRTCRAMSAEEEVLEDVIGMINGGDDV